LPGGQEPQDIAHLLVSPNQKQDPESSADIYIDRPNHFTQPVLDHELMHVVQANAGSEQRFAESDVPGAAVNYADYGYGGAARLKGLRSVHDLNVEQQGDVVRDYADELQNLRRYAKQGRLGPKELQQADEINDAYARPMRQFAAMARTQPGIDVTPAPPGPPPAALTGSIKPLPEWGGPSINATSSGVTAHSKQRVSSGDTVTYQGIPRIVDQVSDKGLVRLKPMRRAQ
jgi:hypothetical protein